MKYSDGKPLILITSGTLTHTMNYNSATDQSTHIITTALPDGSCLSQQDNPQHNECLTFLGPTLQLTKT